MTKWLSHADPPFAAAAVLHALIELVVVHTPSFFT
jgi:hypothetical protein